MKPTPVEFRELDHNIRGEEKAIHDYILFGAHLMAKGRYAEANKIREIKHEEMVHLRELHEMERKWKGMK